MYAEDKNEFKKKIAETIPLFVKLYYNVLKWFL